MILDPLISSEAGISAPGWDEIATDVAYDATNDVYLAVWQREFSGQSSEIRSQLVSPTGSLVGSLQLIASTTATSPVNINASVANVAKTSRFLVVWQHGTSMFGPFDLACAAVMAGGGFVSATVR